MATVVALAVAGASFISGALLGRWSGRRKQLQSGSAQPLTTAMTPEEYEERQKEALRIYEIGQKQFDRLIPWGSGGALLLSVTLLQKVQPTVDTKWILGLGWVALFVGLSSSVVSHYASAWAYWAEVQANDLSQQPAVSDRDRRKHDRRMRVALIMGRLVTPLNAGSLIGFLFGVAALMYFAYQSI